LKARLATDKECGKLMNRTGDFIFFFIPYFFDYEDFKK